ncbi:hypothetical protein BKA69DRAFT_649096 [Paraphysoderma sedebokerense]|nr:hypothetical protein BKA69DRAFT_649096 [Paraphysoderma sedebokerense]
MMVTTRSGIFDDDPVYSSTGRHNQRSPLPEKSYSLPPNAYKDIVIFEERLRASQRHLLKRQKKWKFAMASFLFTVHRSKTFRLLIDNASHFPHRCNRVLHSYHVGLNPSSSQLQFSRRIPKYIQDGVERARAEYNARRMQKEGRVTKGRNG